MEAAKELTTVKHSHLSGISYPIFKECLLEWIEKTLSMLASIVYIEDKKVPYNMIGAGDKDTVSIANQPISVQLPDLSEVDTDMVMLHRSLYILKRKYDLHENEINNIYRKYMEPSKIEFVLDVNRFNALIEEITEVGQFTFANVKKPSDLFRVQLIQGSRSILKQIEKFMLENRKKYNDIMKEKKEKGYVDLRNYENYKTGEDNHEDMVDLKEEDNDDKHLDPEEEKQVEGELKDTMNEKEVSSGNQDEVNAIEDFAQEKSKEESVQQMEGLSAHPDVIQDNLSLNDDIKKDNTEKENNEESILHKESLKENKKDVSLDENPLNVMEDKVLNHEEMNKLMEIRTKLDDDIRSITLEPKPNFATKNENISQIKLSNKERKQHLPNEETFLPKRDYNNQGMIKYILIEILPLIIADFIQENNNTILLDSNDELKSETRSLFDNEIMQRLGEMVKQDVDEERTEKLKNLLLEKLNLEKNIRTYEDLIIKKKSSKENTHFIEQMLEKLNKQKILLESEIKKLQEDNETANNYNIIQQEENPAHTKQAEKNINVTELRNDLNLSKTNKKTLTKEEIRLNALKEIFYFYSRQHQLLGYKATFDSIRENSEHMDLSEYFKFCVEFKILVPKEKLVELFKKTASNLRQMSFEEFLLVLQKISVGINDEKKKILRKRINRYRSNLKQFEDQKKKEQTEQLHEENNQQLENQTKEIQDNLIIPEVKNNEGKPFIIKQAKSKNKSLIAKQSSIMFTNTNDIKEEIIKCQQSIDQLNNKSFTQLLEELYLFLEIDNDKLYRKKMNGFVLPFKTHDKSYRIPSEIKRIKKLDPHTTEEIKRILNQRKEEQRKEEQEKENLDKLEDYAQKKQLHAINEKLRKEHERILKGRDSTYQDIRSKKSNYDKEKEHMLTWDQLEKLDFNHFVTNREDDFNPKEFLGLEDEEDSDGDLVQSGKTETQKGNKSILNYTNAALIENERHLNKEHKKEESYIRKDLKHASIKTILMNSLEESKMNPVRKERKDLTKTKKDNLALDKNQASQSIM